MNCKKFKNWLLLKDKTTLNNIPEDIAAHLSECPDCRQIYLLDTGLEIQIKTALIREKMPAGLKSRIESNLAHAADPSRIKAF